MPAGVCPVTRMADTAVSGAEGVVEQSARARVELVYDAAINFAFQQNAIPVVKELRFLNDAVARRDLLIRVSVEPAFAAPAEIRVQAIEAEGEFRVAPLDLKLGPDFLAGLREKVAGWLKVEVFAGAASGADGGESASDGGRAGGRMKRGGGRKHKTPSEARGFAKRRRDRGDLDVADKP